MRGLEDDAVDLISGLLGHMRQIVGEGASYAMLHYGAVEEGKRLGAAYGAADLAGALERLDAILLQKSEILADEAGRVTLRVQGSSFLATGQRSVQGVVVGLLEGCLAASRQARFTGEILSGGPEGVTIELKADG